MKFGRIYPSVVCPHLRLARYVAAMPAPPPASVDWTVGVVGLSQPTNNPV
jgi:hypothetical protein